MLRELNTPYSAHISTPYAERHTLLKIVCHCGQSAEQEVKASNSGFVSGRHVDLFTATPCLLRSISRPRQAAVSDSKTPTYRPLIHQYPPLLSQRSLIAAITRNMQLNSSDYRSVTISRLCCCKRLLPATTIRYSNDHRPLTEGPGHAWNAVLYAH